jgi:ParB family chromosome partitioning protein
MAFSLTGGKNFLWLAPEQITVNPNQPRKLFREEDLAALTDSIIRYGILQPLTVRREKGSYQLVAGERRLRAAGRAGLRRVPCFLVETDQQGSSLMALVENLQRRDLDPFEEAEGLLRLTKLYGMTQKEAAE